MTPTTVYWTRFQRDDTVLHLAASDAGLCRIAFANEPFDALVDFIQTHFPGADVIEDDERMRPYLLQIEEYFQGERSRFSLPLDLRGTAFQRAVWAALAEIPYGEVRSYADIADVLRNPKAVRAVGAANGRNPIPIVIPCHRVIGKSGKLTGFRGGLRMKEKLLRLEGMDVYDASGHARFEF